MSSVREFRCCICGKKTIGYGCDPRPVKQVGACCKLCDDTVVLIARIKEMKNNERKADRIVASN